MSAEDLLTCCLNCGAGCRGGDPGEGWLYWNEEGLVSGGLYGTHDGCQPYEIKPCFVNGTRVPCEEGGRTPYCQRTCESGYPKSYSDDKTFGDEPYRVAGKSNVRAIQLELMKNGPVEAIFTVFSDFPHYRSGVYQQVKGHVLGDHAIRDGFTCLLYLR